MSRRKLPKPTIVHISPEETLVVFPIRPGVTVGQTCNLPFDEIKHLLSDRPLGRPYGRGIGRKRRGKPSAQSARTRRKSRRAPKS